MNNHSLGGTHRREKSPRELTCSLDVGSPGGFSFYIQVLLIKSKGDHN